MNRVLFFISLFFSFQAIAEDEISLRALCEIVDNKVKKESLIQGADYVEGVDVHGESVVPADLDQNNSFLHDPIIVPIQLGLLEAYGLDLPDGIMMEPELMRMNIYADGHITYGTHEITDALRKLCDKRTLEDEKSPQSDGHKAPDFVGSQAGTGDVIEGQYPE